MDLRQLDALVAVADYRTFSAAADALHTVQSNISSRVAKLEAELGVVLVERGANRLTPAGQVVVDRARRVTAELGALLADVASTQSEVAGPVRLGVIGTTGRWLIPELLVRLRAQHPRIDPLVREATTAGLLPQLGLGRIDLVVVNLPLDDRDLLVQPLFEEELVVIVPEGHPLSGLGSVGPDRLSLHPLLIGPPGNALRDAIDGWAADQSVTLQVEAAVDGVRLVASLAMAGMAPAVVPASALPAPSIASGGWSTLTLERSPRRRVGLARRERSVPSAPAQTVETLIREILLDGSVPEGVHPLG